MAHSHLLLYEGLALWKLHALLPGVLEQVRTCHMRYSVGKQALPVFAKKTAVDNFFAIIRKFWETSETDFNRHFLMKLSRQGSGERGKRPGITFFAAVFFVNTGRSW